MKSNQSFMQRLLFLAFTLVWFASANAVTEFTAKNEDGVAIRYQTMSSNSALVLSWAYSGHVRIPATVDYEGQEYVVSGLQDMCFFKCESLTSVSIPQTITSIPNMTFQGCVSLETVELPETIISIGHDAFNGCNHLTNFDITHSVKTISNNAFLGCTALKRVSIPKSVLSIESFAFGECYSLETIVTEIEEPFALSSSVFYLLPKNAVLYVPYGTKEKYQNTHGWDCFKEIIEMESVLDGLEIQLDKSLQTFTASQALDFSNVGGPQAYIASGFNPTTGEVWMSRVESVPANTGILLMGNAGNAYKVPFAETDFVYSNLLVGALNDMEITNGFVLKDGVFRAVEGSAIVQGGEAYLNIPYDVGKKQLKLKFTDTLNEISDIQSAFRAQDNVWYNLQGVRLQHKPAQRGVYLHQGRKVLVK